MLRRYGLLLSSSGEGDPVEIRLEVEAESEESAKLRIPSVYKDKGYVVKEVKEI